MIFLDTTVWVGAVDASDRCHPDARLILEALVRGDLPLSLTSDYVLNETLTILKARGLNPKEVADAVIKIMLSPKVQVVFVDEAIFEGSLPLYVKYNGLSFTDAASLFIMRKYGVKEIYSHDSDFDKVGWVIRKERP